MLSLNNFNELVELEKKGLLSTSELEELEPYRIKRAIFFAAGLGSRLQPLTLEKPKPMIEVHGKRMIDTLLDGVLNLGIEDITIIRGYKKECLDLLLEKYPTVKFLDNGKFNYQNSISSAILACGLFENTLVMESDLILYNMDILPKYVYHSGYIGYKVQSTDDWCFDTTDLKIDQVNIGGKNTHQMVGISVWNKADGKKLTSDLTTFYSNLDNQQRFWDEVSLIDFKENYSLYVYEVDHTDIIEIDSYEELKAIDSSYI